jgi:hypothetical protein
MGGLSFGLGFFKLVDLVVGLLFRSGICSGGCCKSQSEVIGSFGFARKMGVSFGGSS